MGGEQSLDGDPAIEPGVACLEDLAESATPEHADNLIAPDRVRHLAHGAILFRFSLAFRKAGRDRVEWEIANRI